MELDESQSPVFRDLGNGLLVSYVVDRGSHFEFVTHGQLADQGLSVDELHRRGVDNLADAVAQQGLQVHPHGAYFAAIAGGNLEASLLLLDDLWDRDFRPFVAGDYLVAVPARDVLAFASADDPAAHAQLRDMIARVWPASDHLLSDALFTRADGAWQPLRH